VNNAAADIAGFIEYVDPDVVRTLHEINVVGPLKLTQATLPLIRKATGRIVNISSIAGKVSLPLEGPYSMSKFALEAMTDALRFELRDSGIKVSLIEPGPIHTPMLLALGDRAQTVLDSLPPEGAAYYGDLVRAMQNQSKDLSGRAETPEDVAKLIEHAVESANPKIRYLITKDAKQLNFIRNILPDKAFDALMKMQYLS
jgi:NAD(P)-dependent dehydrogenase (short-subunit alcohol dehydrogenase family)